VRESGFDIQRVIELIAERKIEEAMQEGKFDDLPGKGKPLPLDEEWFAPPELRPAIRLLKSAGVLPDWMERAREIERLRAECDRLWRIAELEYPRAVALRRAISGVAGAHLGRAGAVDDARQLAGAGVQLHCARVRRAADALQPRPPTGALSGAVQVGRVIPTAWAKFINSPPP
jgi:hypothetical protein